MAKQLDGYERRELYEQYIKLQESLYEISHIIRGTKGYDAAKGYWYASLSQGINDSEYPTLNPTFETYLKDHGIIDDDGEFIELEEEEEG